MAKFESRFKELGFYVEGRLYKFSNGKFQTEDKKVIDVLGSLSSVSKIDEPKQETKEEEKHTSKKTAKKPTSNKNKPKASEK